MEKYESLLKLFREKYINRNLREFNCGVKDVT